MKPITVTRRLAILLLFTIFAIGFTATSRSQAKRLSPEDWFERASAKDSLKDYRGAVADFNKAIELEPDYVGAYLGRGIVKGKLKDHQGAVADFNKAIELAPDNALAYASRGIERWSLNDHQGAVADFNKAIELEPDDAKAYYGRGLAKMSLEDKRGALADFKKATILGMLVEQKLLDWCR